MEVPSVEIKTQNVTPADISSRGRVCLICQKQFAKYTCPKCNTPYCSLVCYKNHSNQCTENFYKESIDNTLKGQKVSQDEKNEMAKILKREFERAQEEGDAIDFMTENLENLDLDDPNLFDKLTKEQQQDFLRAISDGRIGRVLEIWEPWWMNKPKETPKIVEITEEEEETENKEEKRIPKILENISPLSSLTKVNPSPKIKYNLLDLLYSYCYAARFFNGDLYTEVLDSADSILQLSSVLSSNKVYESTKDSILQLITNSMQPAFNNSPAFSVAIIQDLSKVLAVKEYILMILSDVYNIIKIATKQVKNETSSNPKMKKLSKEFGLAEKKIFFFLSWANDQDDSTFTSLELEVTEEWISQNKMLEMRKQTK